MRRFGRAAAALAAVLGASGPTAADAAEVRVGGVAVFETRAERGDDLSIFAKWTRAVAAQGAQMSKQARPCAGAKEEGCFLAEWLETIRQLEKYPRRVQLELLNRKLNQSPYVQDIVNWGMEDYWATPLEFLMMSGDCEDYAIAKFFSLLRLGFANEDMHIIVVQDQNLRIAHAVLAVRFEGVTWILDNQIPQVVRDSLIRHYRPLYGVNLTGYLRFFGR